MAIVMEGFSIREYTSKMRNTYVQKCWPFGETSEEVVKATLPPMTVEKFSWWFDKLQLAQPNDNADDADDDESLQSFRDKKRAAAAEKGKAKAKAPKKRSIVELFAAVPQVEKVSYSSEDGGEGSDDEEDKKKRGKGKAVMIKDMKREKPPKKVMGKNVAMALSAIIMKEKASNKLKLQSSADVAKNCNSSMHGNGLLDGFSTRLKKSRMKRSSPQKSKSKTSSNHRLRPNDQPKGLAVHGIHKDQSTVAATENYSNPVLPDATKIRNGNEHMSISAIENALKASWKDCPTVIISDCDTIPHVSVDSSANHQASGIETSGRAGVMNRTEEERTQNGKDKFVVQQVTEKPGSSRHFVSDGSNFVPGQHNYSQANLLGKLAVPYGEGSQHMSRSPSRVTMNEGLNSCFPPYNRNVMIPCSNPRFLDLPGCAGPRYYSDCSMDFMKTYPRPPTPYYSPARNNVTSSPFITRQNNIGKNHCEQALFPQELMHKIWKSRAPSRHKETGINKDSVGLPLNSLGGLISGSSSGRDGFNHVRSKNAIGGQHLSSGMHSNMIKHCVPDHFDAGKSNSVKNAFDCCLESVDSIVERMKVFHIDCRPGDNVQGNDVIRKPREPDHHISLQVTRSTMRLMGKNLTIGGRDLVVGFDSRKGSTVKSGIEPSSSSISCQDNSPRFVVHPILGKLRETVADLPKLNNNRALERNPSVLLSESKLSSQLLGTPNNVRRSQIDFAKSKGMLMPEFHSHGSMPSSPSPNRYQYPTLSSAYNSHPESSQISIPTSTSWGSSQILRTTSNVPVAGKYIPFNVVHPPWSQTAPYVMSSKEKRTLMNYCQPSSVPDKICYRPRSISGANYGTQGSAISRAQSFRPSSFSVRPVYGRYSLDNQMKPRVGVRVPGPGGICKRRIPATSNVSSKPPKIPKIRIQDDCSILVVDLEASSSSVQGDSEPVEPSSDAGESLPKNELANSEPGNSASQCDK